MSASRAPSAKTCCATSARTPRSRASWAWNAASISTTTITAWATSPGTSLICRLIFLIRLLKLDTVFCYDPWGHDEENPDHWVLSRSVEAACWMAGRVHDYPEQFA